MLFTFLEIFLKKNHPFHFLHIKKNNILKILNAQNYILYCKISVGTL